MNRGTLFETRRQLFLKKNWIRCKMLFSLQLNWIILSSIMLVIPNTTITTLKKFRGCQKKAQFTFKK